MSTEPIVKDTRGLAALGIKPLIPTLSQGEREGGIG
jgi:hypothetical protein